MSVTEARAALPEVLDRVDAGEEVTITRHGRPIAVVVRPDALATRRAARLFGAAEELADVLDQGRRTALADAPTIPPGRADELVRALRADRDAH